MPIAARLPTVGRRALFLLLAGAACGLGACQPKPDAKAGTLPQPVSRTGVSRAGERVNPPRPDLSRPVARPADVLDRQSSRLRVEVRQLGSVPYDGLNLPVVGVVGVNGGEGGAKDAEPDVWIATQTGITPPWPVLLADGTPDSRRVPPGVRVMAFRASRKDGTLRPASWVASPPRGVIVGRSADSAGFLVEGPQADGSRWIGRVEWESGHTEWLIGGEGDVEGAGSVNAFATLTPGGDLAFSRRAVGELRFDLVVREAATGRERVLRSPGGDSLVFPWCSADPSRIYAFALPRVGSGSPRVIAAEYEAEKDLRVTAFADVRFEPSIGTAWQAVTCLTTPWPSVASGPLAQGAAMFSMETGSMVWMDGASGALSSLAKGTVGAIGTSGVAGEGKDVSGVMLGAAGALVYQTLEPDARGRGPRLSAEMEIMRGARVPRGVWRGAGRASFVLVSPPVAGTGDEVGVFEAILEGASP